MNSKGNLIGLGIMAVAAVAVVGASGPIYNSIKNAQLQNAAGGEEITTVSGEAEGYGGPITAQVTLAGDRIIGLEITGSQETPDIGGAAITSLTNSILENQSLEGVEAVSGAT